MQAPIKEGRPFFVAILGMLALFLFGLAFLGFVVPPGAEERQQIEISPQILKLPPLPPDFQMAEFWQEAGFYVANQEEGFELKRQGLLKEHFFWFQQRQTWVVVPKTFGKHLGGTVLQLVQFFLERGWLAQIEMDQEGYTLTLWKGLADLEQKMPFYIWHLKTLSPKNHSRYVLGHIPLRGGLFDPHQLERATPQLPVLAIIIDDWGYASEAVEPLLNYPLPLTMAILPHLSLSYEVSVRASQKGHDVILHQPMEALDSTLTLGQGGITTSMPPGEIAAQLRGNLESLPLAIGVNNHMGSRATAETSVMEEVLQVIKETGLFFVDSRTTAQSVVGPVAESLGVAYSQNDLFLDNENDVQKIKEQIRKGVSLAQKRGHAVVIGHVRPQTALALWEMIPELLDSGVQLVPVSTLAD